MRVRSIGRHSGTRLAFDSDARRDPAWGARRRRARGTRCNDDIPDGTANAVARPTGRSATNARPEAPASAASGRSGAMAGSGDESTAASRARSDWGSEWSARRGGRPARAAEAGWQRDFRASRRANPIPATASATIARRAVTGGKTSTGKARTAAFPGVSRASSDGRIRPRPRLWRSARRSALPRRRPRLVAVRQRRRTRRAAQSSRAERLYAIGRADPRRCASGSRMHSTST